MVSSRLVTVLGTAVVLVLVLVLGTVLVRQDVPTYAPPVEDPSPAEVRCTSPFSADGLHERGFVFAGTVAELAGSPAYDGEVRARLDVDEWYQGPSLARLEVSIPVETVTTLGVEGEPLAVGDELLVAGDAWTSRNPPYRAVAWGCGWTRQADEAAVQQWSEALGEAAPATEPEAATPFARYPAVGYVTARPALRGVLVRDGGCLYVQDGERRWLPVFPDDDDTRWQEETTTLERPGGEVSLAHLTALGGGPAATRADAAAGFAVPAGCDPDVARWVVGDAVGGRRARRLAVSPQAPVVQRSRATLESLDLDPELLSSSLVYDAYGRTVPTAEFRAGGWDLSVRMDTAPAAVVPQAYEPRPGDLEILDVGGIEVGLVTPSEGGYLQAVVLLRSGIVATVTSWRRDNTELPDGRLLAEVAAGIADY